jgi:hypothetical protein
MLQMTPQNAQKTGGILRPNRRPLSFTTKPQGCDAMTSSVAVAMPSQACSGTPLPEPTCTPSKTTNPSALKSTVRATEPPPRRADYPISNDLSIPDDLSIPEFLRRPLRSYDAAPVIREAA